MMSLSININHDNLNEVPTGEGASYRSSAPPGLQRVDSKGSFRICTNFYGHFVLELVGKGFERSSL